MENNYTQPWISFEHSWNISPQEAIASQEQMRYMVIQEDALGSIHKVAGVDVGFVQRGKITRAAVVLLDIENLTLLDSASAEQPTTFPYIPGLLSFREAPTILEAMSKLSSQPDLLVCDGHGLAHPRRFGIACHLGVILDIPTIGIAKKRLTGEYRPVPDIRGAWQPLRDGDEIIGAVLRTRTGVKPVFVSVGHRICLQTAIDHLLQFTSKYRLPEPIRLAHQRASETWMRSDERK